MAEEAGFPPTPSQDYYDQPGQEITMDNTGKTIVAGSGIDIHSNVIVGSDRDDDDDEEDHSDIQLYTKNSSGSPCHWLKTSSSKVKMLLSFAVILLLAFVAVMAVGLAQMSSPDSENGDGSGGVSSAQLGGDTNNDFSENDVDDEPMTVSSSPTMKPTEETTTSSSNPPTTQFQTFSFEGSEVQIWVPNDLERMIANLGDETDENWDNVEAILEETITLALEEQLSSDYSVEFIYIEQFDDFQLVNSNSRRELQEQDGTNIHSVIYSMAITVNCARSECTSAPERVEDAVTHLSQMSFLRVESLAPTNRPSGANSFKRTSSPTAEETTPPTNAPSTPATDITDTTSEPTIDVTSKPSYEPSSADPTMSPSGKPTEVPRLEIGSCSQEEPCGMCKGQCQTDNDCKGGLLCFQRRYLEYIPGCIGPGNEGSSYCYDPFAEGATSLILLSADDVNCDDKKRCEKCQGDCDTDDDCDKNLYCYRRMGFELVPGCAGQGAQGRDYCFDPKDLPNGDYRH